MLTQEQILEVERIENAHHESIRHTFGARSEGKKEWQAWKEATSAWHSQRYPTDILWEDAFLDRLRASDREAIEDAILFLEIDPWYFRSGYLKERLIRGLKAAELTERDKTRLRYVLWNVARGKNRREFRHYCSLALKILTPEFERILGEIPPEEDMDAKGKFSYLRNYIVRNKKSTEPSVAQRRSKPRA